MRQCRLYGAVLLLGLGLLACPGRGRAQSAGTPTGLAPWLVSAPPAPRLPAPAPAPAPPPPAPLTLDLPSSRLPPSPLPLAASSPLSPSQPATGPEPVAPPSLRTPPPPLNPSGPPAPAPVLVSVTPNQTVIATSGAAAMPDNLAPPSGVQQAVFNPQEGPSPASAPLDNGAGAPLSATTAPQSASAASSSAAVTSTSPAPTVPAEDSSASSASSVKTPGGPGTPGAALSIDVSGPVQVAPGQALPCTMVVRNTGTVTATLVKVEQLLPAGVRLLLTEPPAQRQGERLSWDLGNLEAGAERRLHLEVQSLEPGEVCLAPSIAFSSAGGLRARVVQPPFALLVTGPDAATVGGQVTFRIQVANHTDAPVQHVVIHDVLPAGLQHPQGNPIEADLGTLAPGEVRTIDLETTAARTGPMINEVSARADGGLRAQARAAVQVNEPVLALRLKGPRQALIKGDIEFQLEVSNPGRGPATGLRLTQSIPGGLDFASASTGGTLDPGNRQVVWSLGNLPGGQTQTVTLRLRPRLAGDWALRAVAQADSMAEARATGAIHLEGVPALSLEVVAQDDPIDPGAETVYEMRVLNQGNGPSTDIRLVAWLPDGLIPIRPDGPTPAQVRQQQIVFEPLAQLRPREDVVYRIRVRGRQPSEGRFRVELTTASLPRPVREEISTHVRAGAVVPRPGPPPTPQFLGEVGGSRRTLEGNRP